MKGKIAFNTIKFFEAYNMVPSVLELPESLKFIKRDDIIRLKRLMKEGENINDPFGFFITLEAKSGEIVRFTDRDNVDVLEFIENEKNPQSSKNKE